jgi:hypothetical protein
MDSRNYINSDHYVKLLREKTKRENKVAKMQNKILTEQQKQLQQKPLCPKKPKKLSEKWIKQQQQQQHLQPKSEMKNEMKNSQTKCILSQNSSDLLSEIDNSLQGYAKGFVYKEGKRISLEFSSLNSSIMCFPSINVVF